MSFDLAVWEGPMPPTNEAAAGVFRQLMDRLERGEAESQASPRIRAYVGALLARWPDITGEPDDESPWADGPLIANAFGEAIYFSMVWSRADEAAEFAARVAAEHGLVCFDPQSESLLPRPPRHGPIRRPWLRRTR